MLHKRKEQTKMMEYREFVEKIKQDIEERLKGECDVTVKTDLRNNGVLSEVLSIQPVKGASGTASVIPLRQCYKPCMSKLELNKIAARWPAEAVV